MKDRPAASSLPVGTVSGAAGSVASMEVASSGGALTSSPPTARPQLEELIRVSLGLPYVSSGKEGIETGNHYQSVSIGDAKTSGFRSDRSAFLNRVDFRGRKVLDLGSNLGELSRSARARGADVVDGFEYDPFFVEVAHLLNAYNFTTRVSFFQRDITDPKVYVGHYDIVMAFAVWTYVRPILSSISRITEALLLETHKLNGNLERDYTTPISRFFPHTTVLGESDWGRTQDPGGGRAVLLCAKTGAALEQALAPTAT